MVGHHESGVEAHAELADHVDLVGGLVILRQIGLELPGPAAGNGAQVGFQILLAHAHTIVRYREQPGFLIGDNGNFQVLALYRHAVVGERLVRQLVLRVTGVGDQLPQKNLLVGVDGVDHQIQQPLGFRFKLLLCHNFDSSMYIKYI